MSNSLRHRDYETSCPGDINLYDEEVSRRVDARVSFRERARKLQQWEGVNECVDGIEAKAHTAMMGGDQDRALADIVSLCQSLRRQIYSRVLV